MEKRQTLKNEHETQALGANLARVVACGDCLVLRGHVGAGKTSLARGLIQALARRDENVPSPTFTLVQTYDTDPPLWHVDLYRLERADEIIELGILEALDDAAVVIEWADKIKHLLPAARLEIELAALSDDFNQREVQLKPFGKKWEQIVHDL